MPEEVKPYQMGGRIYCSVTDNIATLTINHYDTVKFKMGIQQTNTLNRKLVEQIDAHLDSFETDKIVNGIVITGIDPANAPPVFCDGLDLRYLGSLRFLDFGNDMDEETSNHDYGIKVFNRIQQFSKPVIARINGHCIGGGLELAMACHHLVAVDNPRIKIGFPEVRYRFLPGWEGLQRLAKRMGKDKALELFFEGFFEKSEKHPLLLGLVNIYEAKKSGIIDAIQPEQDIDEYIMDILR